MTDSGRKSYLQSSRGAPEPAANQSVMDLFDREATRNPKDNKERSQGLQ